MTYTPYTNVLANANLDTWLPDGGRTVPDIPSYFRNNAVGNIKDFGAKCDGTTDDTAAINAALASTSPCAVIPPGVTTYVAGLLSFPAGSSLRGWDNTSVLKASRAGAQIATLNGRNRIASLQVTGSYAAGFDVQGDDCSIVDVYFNDAATLSGDQCVRLFTAKRTLVANCTFDSTGYAVVQQSGYASSQGRVIGNAARNVRADFVELNSASVASEDWIIAANTYDGARGYPSPQTETRFVGVTNCHGVIIEGNTISRTAGDAAIHLEGTAGLVSIAGNTFRNCVPSNGNAGYIYLLTSSAQVTVRGNTFSHDDTTIAAAYCLDMTSGAYSAPVIFAENMMIGNTGHTLGGIACGQGQGAVITITGNVGQGMGTFLSENDTWNLTVTGNDVVCNKWLLSQVTETSGGGGDFVVTGNVIRASDVAVGLQGNTNGTNLPRRMQFTGNRIVSGTFLIYDGTDILAAGNAYPSTQQFNPAATMYVGPTRVTSVNNAPFA